MRTNKKYMNDSQLFRFYSIMVYSTLFAGVVGCCSIITNNNFIFGSCILYMVVCAIHVYITSSRIELHEQTLDSFK